MEYDPDIHHRRSIRLPEHDYSLPGSYFVTICTKDRTCFLGEIIDEGMHLNKAGEMIEKLWLKLPDKFSQIELDSFIIMPNHFHGIINILKSDLPFSSSIDKENVTPLPEIIQWFKTMTTNKYIKGVKNYGWTAFNGKLWQRNYYEHVIRNDESLNKTREYIEYNPHKWKDDVDNPENF